MSLHLRCKTVMYIFRGYHAPGGFAAHRPYDLVGSIFMLGAGQSRLFATHGDLEDAAMRGIADFLDGEGIHTALVNRHGDEKRWKVSRWKLLGRSASPVELHFEPATVVVQGYATQAALERQAPPDLEVAVYLAGDGSARIFCGPADLPESAVRGILGACGPLGVRSLTVDRYGVEQTWINQTGAPAH